MLFPVQYHEVKQPYWQNCRTLLILAGKILLRNPTISNNNLANILGWIGISLIILAFAVVRLSTVSPFPGWWAVYPVIGAFFLIAAGDSSWINRHILGRKFAVSIGLISYPLYLWHWPILAFTRIFAAGGVASTKMRFVVITLSVILAWATYEVIEKRLRFRSGWGVTAGLLFILVMIATAGYQIYQHSGYEHRLMHLRSV